MMKSHSLVFRAVLCLVRQGNCGTISAVPNNLFFVLDRTSWPWWTAGWKR